MIYAKDGSVIENDKIKIFRLYNGQIINKDENKINIYYIYR